MRCRRSSTLRASTGGDEAARRAGAELKLDPVEYCWYRDLNSDGTVLHARVGLGLNSSVAYATGMATIRDVIP
ncbi:MAG TPA: hypothetical protein VF337_01830, partial [Candidatus Limnocylindrales bacterium]